MNNMEQGLKAILFDLGGVIIDLHYERTASQLAARAGISMEEIGDLLVTSDVLQRFEVGGMSEEEFRLEMCDILHIDLETGEFESIWNALLGEISCQRIDAIKELNLKTLILSNTNSIHERAFNEILFQSHQIATLHELVDRVYFSHEVGMRKPNAEIYEMVIADQKIRPDEILFIDDRADNIEAAMKLGFRVFQNMEIDNWLQLPMINS